MSASDRFDELVGDIADPAERERLRRVHEMLLTVEAPPELSAAPDQSPVRALRQRRRYAMALIAAALAAAVFGAGWWGGARSDNVAPDREIMLHGSGPTQGSSATIKLLPQDDSGNWPMEVLVRGLRPSTDRTDYYELWLTKDGRLADSCGRFTLHTGVTTVTLSVPYGLKGYDDWVVTRRGSDEILLTT